MVTALRIVIVLIVIVVFVAGIFASSLTDGSAARLPQFAQPLRASLVDAEQQARAQAQAVVRDLFSANSAGNP